MMAPDNSCEELDYDTEGVEDDGYYSSSSSDGSTRSTDKDVDEQSGNDEHEGIQSTDNPIESSHQATAAPQSEEKRVRGLTRLKELRMKWKGKKRVVEFDGLGRFKGKYKSQIASYMGVLVRKDVGLRYLSWKKVPPEVKEKLWEEIVRFYEIDETRKRRMLVHLGEHLRNFRRKLYAKFILPNLARPAKLKIIPRQYRMYLDQEQWDEFVTYRLSPECKKLSDAGAEARANYKYEHRLGRAGYSGLLEKLIEEKEIREDENPSRSLLWRKARQNKNGEYDDNDVKEKAAQLEEFDKQLEDGTVPKELGKDSLTLVFGEEHGGRVRCAGKGVTPTNYWHLPRRGASKESVAELKILLDNERRENQRENEKKDEQIKEALAKMDEQTKMMNELKSQLVSKGLLKKKTSTTKKEKKSPETRHSAPTATQRSPASCQHSDGLRPVSPTERQDSQTTKQKSHASKHQFQSPLFNSQLTISDKNELPEKSQETNHSAPTATQRSPASGHHSNRSRPVSPTERQESQTTKQTSLASKHQPHSSLVNSQPTISDKNELLLTGKCKLAHTTLRNIVAIGTFYQSAAKQILHGVPLDDECIRVSIEKAVKPNHCFPIGTRHLKTVEDAVASFVAWPKTLVISCATMEPLLDPDERDANCKAKKMKKKRASDMKDGEAKPQRTSKRIKTVV